MALILAVEPDRRQAAHLTHVVRHRVGAELILAETTELALASIGNRVPDLILVPALLSPTDDAALAAALRVIATAAHVQMLTTPLFASAAPAPRRGVLSAFRRAKPAKATLDGCDPAEFAQQISSYLESAAEARAVAAAQYVEPAVHVPAPVAQSTGRYVPLEAGRLYREETVAYREIETAPAAETIPEAVPEAIPEIIPKPATALAEPEPLAEISEPVVTFEATQPPEPADYEAIETVDEMPDALIAEPVATLPEPVVETAEPMLEAAEPTFETTEPTFEAAEPMFEAPEPTFEAPEPMFEAPEPTFEAPEPTFAAPEPMFEAPEPTFAAPEPMFAAPKPMFEAPEPMLEAREPLFEAPKPMLEALEPIVETPEPLVATESTPLRRIGFVVHDEEAEPELTPLVAESLEIEADPIEMAASVDAAPAIEAIAAPELVAAISEPAIDETFELIEVVDEDDQDTFGTIDQDAVGTIDLSAEFEDLQIIEEQSDAEVVAPLEALEDDAVEIADVETEPIEIFETPEIVEAVEPAAPQLRAINLDALQEFAATVEAMTAAEPRVVVAGQAAAETFAFEDLFPPREAVEPSPLGAWRSWTPLEGIAAEDAPVPAHVVERAVKRAPERAEWVQLVESLRIDVERRRSEQPSGAPTPVRKTPSRPIQDEWGLFDPAQCGFAALLNKLDEITEASESQPPRSA